jgi:Xaa-Pro aminopeptidase
VRYTSIPSSLFTDRRKEFLKKMKPGSAAIFFSHAQMPRTADQTFPFRQHSGLFSLTGIDQPETILVLFKGASKKIPGEMAFITPHDPVHAVWHGDALTLKEASEISGIKNIKPLDQWDIMMPILFNRAKDIYFPFEVDLTLHPAFGPDTGRKIKALMDLYPTHQFHSSQSLLQKLSVIKHSSELRLMRKAINITELAFHKAMLALRPGMREYEIEAELTYEITRHGGRHAFDPIIASGKNACTLHYVKNNAVIAKDALVLIDFGAEYGNMASDMTRTLPAAGRFNKEQKKLYLAVLRVLNEITDLMRPGMTFRELNKETGKRIERELVHLKIISNRDVRKQDKKSPLWKKYFMHGVSHHLGYDVHDPADRETPFRAGMVLTCEPALYLPGLKTGIRLENDILITRREPENLMAHIPIDPDEIESIMGS